MSLRKHKGWIAVGILLTAGLLFSWRFFRPKGAIAQITYDGKVVCIVDLSTDRDFCLEEDPTVRFRVEEGSIGFIEATGPDKICEQAGRLSRVGETAACLPRKTVVTVISGKKGEADAVAG